ncbi:hypothetical protein GH714_027960 [Hevea brasiliensis]|uniref:Protein kinase domain-containing protein n=1 Tax=Hevea brasiliensis TaxID=3981 RepID=A0A6A6LEQ8_HEVBR|nr:hypothetical protein GH714_027960 [Hevea brasiliensis]
MWGPLPAKINRFWSLQVLNVSSNFIYGEIPQQVMSLKNLASLVLADNLLNGSVPDLESLVALRELNLSGNHLGPSFPSLGKLPSCIASNSVNRTVISSWNCLSGANSSYQHQFAFCHKEALAVKPPAEREKEKSTIKLGLILGIIGGVAGIAGVLGLLIVIIIRRSQTRRAYGGKFDGSFADKMACASDNEVSCNRSSTVSCFTLEEIEDATNNFDPTNFVGEESGTGKVQEVCEKENLLDPRWLSGADKMCEIKAEEFASKFGAAHGGTFKAEASAFDQCSWTLHCYLSGHPSTASTVFVVLEHISNGSLHDYLTDWRRKDVLKWPQRMAITIGVARGIHFLHTGVAPGIFGNNLKIENVLLDESLTAKLSNYNISLPSKVGSQSPLNGLDIHNLSSANAEKEDIYQLGVILVQVITGKLITSPSELEELRSQLEKGLAEAPSKLRAMIDPSTRGSFAYESLRTTVKITINCLSTDSSSRPSIEDVLWNLQYSNQVQEGWTSSGNLGTQL